MPKKPTALVLSALTALALMSVACSSTPASASAKKAMHGTANVGAAGSLEGVVQTSLEPAFVKATGDHFVGKFEGSTDIAQAILDNEFSPGAFVAVGTAAIKLLWPSRAHFAMTLATDPLVVAYSPKSRYAKQLNKIRSGAEPLKDLFTLMEKPGFRLGRTDPNDDPQGGFFILMFELAQKELHLPAGTASKILGTTKSNDIGSSSQLYDEDALPTDIQSATVDAGSEYVTEARQYKLDYITLPSTLNFADPAKSSLYSTLSLKLTGGVVFQGGLITLNDTLVTPEKGQKRSAANQAADNAWIAFLISSKGQSLLKKAGYDLEAPHLELARGYKTAKSVLPSSVLANYGHVGGMVSSS